MATGFTRVGLMSTISSFFWILTGSMIPMLGKKSLEEEHSMPKAQQSVQDTNQPGNQTAVTSDGTVAVVTTAVSEPGDFLQEV